MTTITILFAYGFGTIVGLVLAHVRSATLVFTLYLLCFLLVIILTALLGETQ